MYYLNSRYYSPEWGRFVNADATGGKVGTLLSHNCFAYCMNNPVNLEDPNGNWPKLGKIFKSVVNAIVKHAVTVTVMVIAVVVMTYAIKNPRIIARAGAVGGTAAATEKASEKAESSENLSSKIINGLKSADIKTKVNEVTGNEEPYYKEFKLDDTYKVQLRRDVGEGFNHGDPNYWNLELQTLGGKVRYDLHLYVDKNIKTYDIGEYIPQK